MSSYALRNGVSFCRVGDRFIFLDLPADRYFCLPPASDRAFLSVMTGAAPPQEGLDALVRVGALRPVVDPCPPVACVAPIASRDLADDRESEVSMGQVAEALLRRAACRAWLRLRPLARIIDRIARRKRAVKLASTPSRDLASVSAAHRRASLIFSAHDQCLATSLAMAIQLIGQGVRPDLVLGVRLHPFQAHCWVQVDDMVVTDQVDTIRLFTPILVV